MPMTFVTSPSSIPNIIGEEEGIPDFPDEVKYPKGAKMGSGTCRDVQDVCDVSLFNPYHNPFGEEEGIPDFFCRGGQKDIRGFVWVYTIKHQISRQRTGPLSRDLRCTHNFIKKLEIQGKVCP